MGVIFGRNQQIEQPKNEIIFRSIDEIRENDNKTSSGVSNTQFYCSQMPADCCNNLFECSIFLLQCGHVYHGDCMKQIIIKQFQNNQDGQLFCHCNKKIRLSFLRSEVFKRENNIITQVYRSQLKILIDHLDQKKINKQQLLAEHDKWETSLDYNL